MLYFTQEKHPLQSGCSEQSAKCPYGHRLSCGSDRRGILFVLVSLIEKGKQCHNQTTKGYQQTNNPYKYRNDICICHEHHLPSYVFRQIGFQKAREAATLSWVLFRNRILSWVGLDYNHANITTLLDFSKDVASSL
jgi:hypothetical protein